MAERKQAPAPSHLMAFPPVNSERALCATMAQAVLFQKLIECKSLISFQSQAEF